MYSLDHPSLDAGSGHISAPGSRPPAQPGLTSVTSFSTAIHPSTQLSPTISITILVWIHHLGPLDKPNLLSLPLLEHQKVLLVQVQLLLTSSRRSSRWDLRVTGPTTCPVYLSDLLWHLSPVPTQPHWPPLSLNPAWRAILMAQQLLHELERSSPKCLSLPSTNFKA